MRCDRHNKIAGLFHCGRCIIEFKQQTREEVIEEVFEKIKQLKVIKQGYVDQNKWYMSFDRGMRYLKKELRK